MYKVVHRYGYHCYDSRIAKGAPLTYTMAEKVVAMQPEGVQIYLSIIEA